MNTFQKPYDTNWQNIVADWTHRYLGTYINRQVTHNLNAFLYELSVKLYVASASGIGETIDMGSCFYLPSATSTLSGFVVSRYGYDVWEIDKNNIQVMTGSHGLYFVTFAGTGMILNTQNWLYRIKTWYMG